MHFESDYNWCCLIWFTTAGKGTFTDSSARNSCSTSLDEVIWVELLEEKGFILTRWKTVQLRFEIFPMITRSYLPWTSPSLSCIFRSCHLWWCDLHKFLLPFAQMLFKHIRPDQHLGLWPRKSSYQLFKADCGRPVVFWSSVSLQLAAIPTRPGCCWLFLSSYHANVKLSYKWPKMTEEWNILHNKSLSRKLIILKGRDIQRVSVWV